MTLQELIEQISKRPGMFLGDPTLSRLEMFLVGWTHGQNEFAGETLMGFQRWIERRYEIDSGQSWADIIWFNSSDGASALNLCFDLLKEYFKEIEGKQMAD